MSQQLLRSLDYIVQAYNLVRDNPDEAVRVGEKALICSPRNNLILGHLGYLYKAVGRKDDAREAFEVALKDEPNNSDLQGGLANILIEQGEYESARRIYESILKQEPNNLYSMIGLANCYSKLKREDDMERICLNVVNLGIKTKRRTGWLWNLFSSDYVRSVSRLDEVIQKLEYNYLRSAYLDLIGLSIKREDNSSFFKTSSKYIGFIVVSKIKMFLDSIKP